MRIAAIDIGSNSIHMLVVEARHDRGFEIVDREKDMVRLGTGGLGHRPLSEASIRAGLDTIARFKRLADSRAVEDVVAVATSAVREAPNGGEFLRAVARRTGIRPRVISGIEEARLIHQAAVYGVNAASGRTVVIDIGGGTTEITLGDANTVRHAYSFKLGVIRLTERFVRSDPLSRGQERRLVEFIRRDIGDCAEQLIAEGFDRVIGTSGTMLSLGSIAFHDEALFAGDRMHHRRLPAKLLHRVRKQIVALDMARRLRVPGLDARRADLIVAGAILADTIVRRLGAEEITLCDFALREALVLDYLRRNSGRIARIDQYPDIRRRSVIELAERCGADAAHTAHVARLALSLFDQTRALHELDDRAREWLEYAALLHDIGAHIAYASHHKHSYYLICHGGLRGFEPDEIQVIALIARHHRRRPPAKSDQAFAALTAPLRRTVRLLSALLRVAEGLDRRHARTIAAVRWQDDGRNVQLRVEGADEIEIELWAARRQIGPLEQAFRRHVRIDAGGDHAGNAGLEAPVPGQAARRRGNRRIRKDHAARPAREVAERHRPSGRRH